LLQAARIEQISPQFLLAGAIKILPLPPLPRPRIGASHAGAHFQHQSNSNFEATSPEIHEIFYGEEIRDRMLPVRGRCEKVRICGGRDP
jgi:hypothetical protein